MKCTTCNTVLVEQVVVEALGHTEEIIPAVEATCTEDGLTEGKKCSVCGEITVAQEVVEALGHTEEIIPAVEGTCDKQGLTEGKKCSVCGEILVEQQPTTNGEGHNKVVYLGKEPTCTEEGYSHRVVCESCGEVFFEQEIIEALGHDYEDGKCTVCGEDDPNAVHVHNYKYGYIDYEDYGYCKGAFNYLTCECDGVLYGSTFGHISYCSFELLRDETIDEVKYVEYKCNVCSFEILIETRVREDMGSKCNQIMEHVETLKNIGGKDIVTVIYQEIESHNTTSETYEFSSYGGCGGYITVNTCVDCNRDISYSLDCSDCEITAEKVEKNGEQIYEQKCINCGLLISESYIEKISEEDPCVANAKQVKKVELGGVVFVTREQTATYNNCDLDKVAVGEITDCADGVEHKYTCRTCNQVMVGKLYSHVNILSENIDVSNTECCSSSLIKRYCPCGLSGTLESENCDFVYISISNFYDEYGLPHRIDTTQCKECGIIKEVEDYYVDGVDVYIYQRKTEIYYEENNVLASLNSIVGYIDK